MKYLFYLIALTALSSCYYDIESELYPNCNVPESVSYELDIQPIISGNCAISGCHVQGGTGPGDFSTYNPLKARVDNGTFEEEVISARTMPPSGSLGECNILIIQAWLDAGAPNN